MSDFLQFFNMNQSQVIGCPKKHFFQKIKMHDTFSHYQGPCEAPQKISGLNSDVFGLLKTFRFFMHLPLSSKSKLVKKEMMVKTDRKKAQMKKISQLLFRQLLKLKK